MGTYVLKTLGCKANMYDSQLIEAELQKRGWQAANPSVSFDQLKKVDLCIVNSCTVTDEADRQSRKMASSLFRVHPQSKVVVTGCSAQIESERLRDSRGIHYVIGNQYKSELVDLILGSDVFEKEAKDSEVRWPDIAEDKFSVFHNDLTLRDFSKKTRSYLKIQEGCNTFCTYCIIPYARGPSRSLSAEEVTHRIEILVKRGIQEVVLTGTNIGDYPDFERLIEKIFAQTMILRLRVSSLDPIEISDSLLKIMEAESRFCPHFHVSLQSAHNKILRLMKRKYRLDAVEKCLNNIYKLNPASKSWFGTPYVGMDVITGFPGESDEDFEEILQTLESLPWSRLHVFPYSERAGTPATRLKGKVPPEIRKERAKRLTELSLRRNYGIYNGIFEKLRESEETHSIPNVLLERPVLKNKGNKRVFEGYSPNYLRFSVEETEGFYLEQNQIISVFPVEIRVNSTKNEAYFVGIPDQNSYKKITQSVS